MKFLKTIIISFVLILSTLADAGFGAHGGDPIEQEWSTLADSVIRIIKNMPKQNILSKKQILLLEMAINNVYLESVPTLKPSSKAALNYPDKISPRIVISRERWVRLTQAEKAGLILHEYLGIIKLELDSYNISKKFRPLLDQQLKDNISNPNPLTPDLLFQNYFDSGRQGMDLDEAETQCSQYKQIFETRYFIVYCIYHQKNWQELRVGWSSYTDYRFMGYVSSANSISMSVNSSIRLGLFSQSISGNTKMNSFTQSPVILPVQVPYSYEYFENKSIYGIKIYGFGKFYTDSPWKTLIRSIDLIENGLISLVYNNKHDALFECGLLISRADDDLFKYYRSKCFIVPSDDKNNPYAYEVRTQNPFF